MPPMKFAFVSPLYVPNGHAVHAARVVLPELGLNVPASHDKQESFELFPVPSLYVPASHSLHDDERAASAYVPAGQAKHTALLAVPPVDGLYVPASQERHALADTACSLGLYEPVGHGSHWLALVAPRRLSISACWTKSAIGCPDACVVVADVARDATPAVRVVVIAGVTRNAVSEQRLSSAAPLRSFGALQTSI